MFEMTKYAHIFFIICMIALGIIVFLCLIRAILGPKFSDRIVAGNMIATKTVAFVFILAIVLQKDFYLDIALIYAMLGFVAVVVLSKIITFREKLSEKEKELKANEELVIDQTNEEGAKK